MHYFDYFMRTRGFFFFFLLFFLVIFLLFFFRTSVAAASGRAFMSMQCSGCRCCCRCRRHRRLSSSSHSLDDTLPCVNAMEDVWLQPVVTYSLSRSFHLCWPLIANLKINDFPFRNWRQAIFRRASNVAGRCNSCATASSLIR